MSSTSSSIMPPNGHLLRARTVRWLTTSSGQRWLRAALLAYAVIGCAVWIQRPGDFAGYVTVGDLALSGRHIYFDAPPGINTWPPFFGILCIPLALLARPTPYLARGIWLGLNFACVVIALRLIAQLVYGRGPNRHVTSAVPSLTAPEILLPLLLSARYVSSNFDHLQINLILFTIALAGLYLQAEQHALLGGVLLGLAAATKIMAVLFLPYLCYRRRWRAAFSMAGATGAFSLSPILVFGWSRFWNYVYAWQTAIASGWGVGRMNQSVFAMWDRWLGHGFVRFTAAGIADLPASGRPIASVMQAATLALVVVLALWSARRHSTQRWARLAEWSIVFMISALFGPVCWKAYLTVLLLPNTLLFAAWRSASVDARTRRVCGSVLAVSFIMGGLTSAGLIGKTLADMLEMMSVPTLSWLVLLAGLLWFRARLSVTDSASTTVS